MEKLIAQLKFISTKVFYGMTAANESLFLALKNGEVVCIKGN